MDDEFARKERPGRSSRGPPKKKKSPLWGMFNGNGDDDKGGNSRRQVREDESSPGRMPERVRLSDIGKDAERTTTTTTDNAPMNRNDATNNEREVGPRNSSGQKQVWGGRYGSSGGPSNATLTDSSYFGPRGGGPGGPGGPYGPPPTNSCTTTTSLG